MRLAGCSVDTVADQQAFGEKLGGLRFPLISDVGGDIAKAYGVFKEEWKVSIRATAVIGEDGTILKTYPDAPGHGKGHAAEVYADLKTLLA